MNQILVGHYTEAEQNKMADLYAKLVKGYDSRSYLISTGRR
jgi:hypothetical protein